MKPAKLFRVGVLLGCAFLSVPACQTRKTEVRVSQLWKEFLSANRRPAQDASGDCSGSAAVDAFRVFHPDQKPLVISELSSEHQKNFVRLSQFWPQSLPKEAPPIYWIPSGQRPEAWMQSSRCAGEFRDGVGFEVGCQDPMGAELEQPSLVIAVIRAVVERWAHQNAASEWVNGFFKISDWSSDEWITADGHYRRKWEAKDRTGTPEQDLAETALRFRMKPDGLWKKHPMKAGWVRDHLYAGLDWSRSKTEERRLARSIADRATDLAMSRISECMGGPQAQTTSTPLKSPLELEIDSILQGDPGREQKARPSKPVERRKDEFKTADRKKEVPKEKPEKPDQAQSPVDQPLDLNDSSAACVRAHWVRALIEVAERDRQEAQSGCGASSALQSTEAFEQMLLSAAKVSTPEWPVWAGSFKRESSLKSEWLEELRKVADPRLVWRDCLKEGDARLCYETRWKSVLQEKTKSGLAALPPALRAWGASVSERYQKSMSFDEVESKLLKFFEADQKSHLEKLTQRVEAIWSTCDSGKPGPAVDWSRAAYSSRVFVEPGRIACLNSGFRAYLDERTEKYQSIATEDWIERRIYFPRVEAIWDAKVEERVSADQAKLKAAVGRLLTEYEHLGVSTPCVKASRRWWFEKISQKDYPFASIGDAVYEPVLAACRALKHKAKPSMR